MIKYAEEFLSKYYDEVRFQASDGKKDYFLPNTRHFVEKEYLPCFPLRLAQLDAEKGVYQMQLFSSCRFTVLGSYTGTNATVAKIFKGVDAMYTAKQDDYMKKGIDAARNILHA